MADATDNVAIAWMYCRKCRHILNGASDGRCPVCQTTFDPDDPKSFRNGPSEWGWEGPAALALGAFNLLFSGLYGWEDCVYHYGPVAAYAAVAFAICLYVLTIGLAISSIRSHRRQNARFGIASLAILAFYLLFMFPALA